MTLNLDNPTNRFDEVLEEVVVDHLATNIGNIVVHSREESRMYNPEVCVTVQNTKEELLETGIYRAQVQVEVLADVDSGTAEDTAPLPPDQVIALANQIYGNVVDALQQGTVDGSSHGGMNGGLKQQWNNNYGDRIYIHGFVFKGTTAVGFNSVTREWSKSITFEVVGFAKPAPSTP